MITKTGDGGETALMYGRRVPKSHPRLRACGALDELTSALGIARASAPTETAVHLLAIQQDLILIMGEVGTATMDLARYRGDGFKLLDSSAVDRLDSLAARIEPRLGTLKSWAIPGSTTLGAALDFARAVARRAEREVNTLQEAGEITNRSLIVYLNRLSDVLWLLARWVEQSPGDRPLLV